MRRRPLALALACALLCALPGLALPWMLDTWFQLAMLQAWVDGTLPASQTGWGGLPALFSFFPGAPDNARLIATTAMPWWADPELRISFLRPLSSLSHLLDFQLFGLNPLPARLHSLAWYALLIVLVARLYRPLGLAGAVALLMFAIDDAHWFPVTWVAGRNALLSAALPLAGLLAWRRWREEAWTPGLPLGLLGLGLGLAAGEGALGVVGLWLCYHLIASPGSRGQRLVSLAPVAVVGAAWAGIYVLGRHGTRASGHYEDPLDEPLRFALSATTRGPMLLGGQVLGLPVDLHFFSPQLGTLMLVGGLVATGLFALGLRLSWPHLDPDQRRELGWLVPGGLLALVPVLAAFPLGRLLLVPGIGLFPALAAMLLVAWRRGHRGVAGLIVLIHLVLPPLGWWGTSALSWGQAAQLEVASTASELPVGPALLLPVADPLLAGYLPVAQRVRGEPFPDPWMVSTLTAAPHRLTRTGLRTLRLDIVGAELGGALFESLYRDLGASPLVPGEPVRHGVATYEVVALGPGGGPTSLVLELDLPVEELPLMRWDGMRFERLPTPALGQTVELPHVRGPMGL